MNNTPRKASRVDQPLASPASHIYFSQRLRLHYIDWGNGDAPPLVLVHGLQDHCRTWDDLAGQLKQFYHIMAPDLRGHGDSEWLRGSAYTYIDYVYDLHQLIQQSGAREIILAGHSLGGAIAALFAGIFPERVKKLVVIEGIGLWTDPQPNSVQSRLRAWVEQTRALAGRQPRRYPTLEAAYGRMQQANPNLAAAQALHLTIHGSNQQEDGSFSWKYDNYTFNFLPTGLPQADVIELWQQITCPVLIINADGGLPHRIGQDGSLAFFSGAQLQVVKNAGHWTYHDQPQVILQAMERFLA